MPGFALRGGLMGCPSPARECFTWHVLPKLPGAKHRRGDDGQHDPWSVRVRCPAHEDTDPSLGVSVADGRIKWNCFVCKDGQKVRMALHRAYGVDLACMPIPAAEKQDILDRLTEILTADTADHAEVRVRAIAALEGHRDLPRGGELARIARLAHTALASAYRARKAGGRHDR